MAQLERKCLLNCKKKGFMIMIINCIYSIKNKICLKPVVMDLLKKYLGLAIVCHLLHYMTADEEKVNLLHY